MKQSRMNSNKAAEIAPNENNSLHDREIGMLIFEATLVVALIAPGDGLAKEVEPNQSAAAKADVAPTISLPSDQFSPYLLAQYPTGATYTVPHDAPTSPNLSNKRSSRYGEAGTGKDYLIPAEEIVGFNVMLNRFNYHFIDKKVYGTTFQSVKQNFSHKWIVDTDPFSVNQFAHPYQGSVYFGLARSTGLDYWQSLGYTFGGSLFWEIVGETGAPSINDLLTTGVGGTFLGEPLFRMASLLLEGGGEKPGVWREVGAAVISPPLGFTRLVFGDRFRAVFDSHDPATYAYLRLGWNKVNSLIDDALSQKVRRNAATADFHMSYGLPGKEGYTYTRPFDYFDFEFTANTANTFENIMSRGLLVGKENVVGDHYRGVWGLYGTYDYISPQIFRVSSTALSLGTSGQWWMSKTLALQGTALAGVGYGAAGTIHGTGERDYHYGATPQALLALRLMSGEDAVFDVAARSYYVSNVASTENRGSERIFRADAALTMRVHGPHAITLKYNTSQRKARYSDMPETTQKVKSLSLLYTYFFGDGTVGAVDWRAPEAH